MSEDAPCFSDANCRRGSTPGRYRQTYHRPETRVRWFEDYSEFLICKLVIVRSDTKKRERSRYLFVA